MVLLSGDEVGAGEGDPDMNPVLTPQVLTPRSVFHLLKTLVFKNNSLACFRIFSFLNGA